MLPIPIPAPSPQSPAPPSLAPLRNLLNLPSEDEHARIAAWLLNALRPNGPHPILVLEGPPASGKSTAVRMLRALIDPSTATFLPNPITERDVMRLAWNHRVLAFDHATTLTPPVAGALCRLSTGAGYSLADHGERDSLDVTLHRPTVLTLPAGDRHAASIANPSLRVVLPPIPPERRRTEMDLWREFEAARPALFASLCTAVGGAMARKQETHLLWAVAGAPFIGFTENQIEAALRPDPIAKALAALVAEQGEWRGTHTELLSVLDQRGVPDLPADARSLSLRLNRSGLSIFGINLEPIRTGAARRIHVTQTSDSSVTLSPVK